MVPTLIMVGGEDDLRASNRDLFEDLGTQRKAMIEIACGTHFMVWEKQRHVLHRASLEWLRTATVNGSPTGRYQADNDGRITASVP